MRTDLRTVLTLVVMSLAVSVARAGVYNTAEPDEGPLDPVFFGKFRDTLLVLRTIGAPQVLVERPLRKRYLLQEELFGAVDPSKLSAEWKLNFGAVLIRRHRYAEAVGLLTPATRQHPELFLLKSNLATAFHLSGDLRRARETMEDCLSEWPKDWQKLSESQRTFLLGIGWNEAPYSFCRNVEQVYFDLLKKRMAESRTLKGEYETPDDLFGVKFVGENGEFEPGKISKAAKAKLNALPNKALDIVQQLLVWMPEDLRLMWLLGEVLNAQGDVPDIRAARKIFDDLVWENKLRAPDLMERRQKLNSWSEPAQAGGSDVVDDDNKPAGTPTKDWRSLLIAFGVGMLVAIFGHWQIREIRRRRQVG